MEQNIDVKHSEYVKSSIEEENVDLENGNNNINDMVQKEDVTNEVKMMPSVIRFSLYLTMALKEKRNVCKRIFVLLFRILIILVGLSWPFQMNIDAVKKRTTLAPITFATIPQSLWLAVLLGYFGINQLYGYFNDGGVHFLTMWKIIGPKQQKFANKILTFILFGIFLPLVIVLIGIILGYIFYFQQNAWINQWVQLLILLRYAFLLIIMSYIMLSSGVFVVVTIVISIGQHVAIERIMKEFKLLMLNHNGAAKLVMDKITASCDSLCSGMFRAQRWLGKFIGMVLFSNIIVVITTLADIAFYTTSSHNTNMLYLSLSCVVVFGMSMVTIILLYFTLRPSLAWTKVMKMLKRPNILHVLSSKYFGIGDTSQGLTLFFEGMEAQRERVVWQCFGVPITVEVYRRAIVSLISIVTLAVGLVVRDIMIKSSNL